MITSPNPLVAQEIAQVNRKFEAAMGRSDADGIMQVYTSSGSIMPPNSPIITGTAAIRDFWQSVIDMGVAGAELRTVELDGLGDTVNEIGQFTLKAADGSVADTGKFIVIWKRENGTWLWHHDIWSSENAAA